MLFIIFDPIFDKICSCVQSYLQTFSFGHISTPRQDFSQQLTFLQQSTVLIWRIGLSRYSAPESNALINTALYCASCRLQWQSTQRKTTVLTLFSGHWLVTSTALRLYLPVLSLEPLLAAIGTGIWHLLALGGQSCILYKAWWSVDKRKVKNYSWVISNWNM